MCGGGGSWWLVGWLVDCDVGGLRIHLFVFFFFGDRESVWLNKAQKNTHHHRLGTNMYFNSLYS